MPLPTGSDKRFRHVMAATRLISKTLVKLWGNRIDVYAIGSAAEMIVFRDVPVSLLRLQ
jgi:hypothetical protein